MIEREREEAEDVVPLANGEEGEAATGTDDEFDRARVARRSGGTGG